MSSETPDRPDPIPWESQPAPDLEKAFAQTILAFFHPRRAWERTPESGGYVRPLLFAAACEAVGALFAATYNLILFQWTLRHHPQLLSAKLPWISGRALLPLTKLSIVLSPIINAILVTLLVFVAAAIIHAGVLIVGARKRSTSGFEGSFRVAAYGSAGLVAQVVPFVGSLIAFVWCTILALTGICRMHRIRLGRAVVAAVAPFAILVLAMLWLTSR